jgi:glycosyltransferase involved in cell wall biosynthesis
VTYIPNFAVISTHNRHQMLWDLLQSLEDIDHVFVIDNASIPAVGIAEPGITLVYDGEQPPNLSRLWNLGLDLARDFALDQGWSEWNVAILNDDLILPPGWVAAVATGLRASGAALASGCQFPLDAPILYQQAGRVPCEYRPAGFARLLKGELGLRFDERMRYWYSDDDLDWRSREHGGSLVLPDLEVNHRQENGWYSRDERLQVQAGLDAVTFDSIWGDLPC